MVELTLFRAPRVFPEFWELPFSQRAAVIAHEAGHRHHRHLWVQLLFMFDSREDRRQLKHAQEFQADDFARALGLGQELANALRRHPAEASDSHPATRDRVARLIR